MDMGLHLAFGGEGQRLGEVLAAAEDGAAQGDALAYDIEDRRGEVTGRQADQTDRALAPPQAERLGEGDRRARCAQHALEIGRAQCGERVCKYVYISRGG